MCGFAGMLVVPGAPVDVEGLRRMTRGLTHRGPDDEGFHEGPDCGLGHRRLSIVDLEGGRQPLAAADGQVQAVVNGEIYNHVALRRELRDQGHVFRTSSDSEVVAHGYAEWGATLPEKLEGMFALAAWDARSRTLLLARDRMGQKPLYYALHRGALLFGSEPKALLAAPGYDPGLSRTGLGRYLAFECLPEDASIFDGMAQVRPAERVLFTQGADQVQRSRYWEMGFGELPEAGAWGRASEPAVVDELERRVLKATERRLMADVPIGVFASGGLDSSIVAAAMARLRDPADVDTFSIGFTDRAFDESGYAQEVAEHLGTRHHVHIVSPDGLLDVMQEVSDLMDEPLADASIFPTYILSRFARRDVKVALGGDGGDELFLGYPTFTAERWVRAAEAVVPRGVLGSVAPAVRWASKNAPRSSGYFPLEFKLERVARGLGRPATERHARWMGAFTPEALAELASLDEDPVRAVTAPFAAWPGVRDDWDVISAQYARLYLAADVLTKVDRASMAHGLEVRAPLLDRAVVELALALPGERKVMNGRLKRLLKSLGERWLPRRIVHRPKRGFAVPMATWLRGPLRALGEQLLSVERLESSGLRPEPVRTLWAAHQREEADHRKPLWTIIALQLFIERWGPGGRLRT